MTPQAQILPMNDNRQHGELTDPFAWGDSVLDSGIQMRLVSITPQIAADMVGRTRTNRTMNDRLVTMYQQEMEADRWQLSGQPIIFDDQHHLIDGQHRLTACVRAGVTIQSLVVYGVDPATFVVLDTGMKRTAAQVLKMAGEINVNNLSAALGVLWSVTAENPGTRQRITPGQRLALLQQHPEVRDAVKQIVNRYWLQRHSQSIGTVSALYYLCKQAHNEGVVNTFFDKLNTGTELKAGSPIIALRDWLSEQARTPGHLRWTEIYPAYLQAWNTWMNGGSLRYIVHMERADWADKPLPQ